MMNRKTITLASSLLLAFSAWAAEPVGRVLSINGDVSIMRAGQPIKAGLGVNIQNGDTLRVGEKGVVQIRFADESIVALRPNTEFRVEDYQFSRNAVSDRSLFGLLKGGMRTITGLIGKANQKNYAVRTETATIGIRGTHFALVSCQNDCFAPDGSKAPNGLFGGVTDGRITVANDVGSSEFGQQEFFRVADRHSHPERLLAPPSFMNEGLLSRRSRVGNALASAASVSQSVPTESSAGSQQVSTSPSSTQMPVVSTVLPATIAQYSTNSQPAVVASGEGLFGAVESSGYPSSPSAVTSVESWALTPADFDGIGYSNVRTPAELAAAQVADGVSVSHDATAGVYWAWEAADASDPAGHFGWHHAWGDLVTNMPTTGSATYVPATPAPPYAGSSTTPRDTLGRTGTFVSSNLTVNFASQTVTSLSAMSISFAPGAGVLTTTTFSIPTQTWAIGSNSVQDMAVSCATCSNVSGYVNGRFFGNGATGLAAAIAVNATVDVGSPAVATPYAAGTVAVFRKQ